MAFLYNPGLTSLHPECFVFHNSDSLSMLFFKINSSELYFNVQNKELFNKARIQVHYRLYYSDKKNGITDSSTLYYLVPRSSKQNRFMTYVPIRTKLPGKYTLEVAFIDYFRNKGNQSVFHFDKNHFNDRNNFFITSADSKEPFFTNVFSPEEKIRLKYNRRPVDKFYVSYYKKEYLLSNPPFVTKTNIKFQNDAKPDSVWSIQNSDSLSIMLDKFGAYCFQTDTNQNDCMCLYNFGQYYPQMKTVEEMIKPVKYLVSEKNKFDELAARENLKLAVDDFWLATTGNTTKSKELIRIFYNRIQLANKYFYSYKEGWKTDRGMVYTVYGPPAQIFKSDNMEKWIYGEGDEQESLYFLFEKNDNRLTDNDYRLKRHELYKTSWFKAIDEWKNGNVFSVENL